MREHLVSVYLKDGVIAHVQSTNSRQRPRDVKEFDSNKIIIPMRRVNLILVPTVEEMDLGADGKPLHRKASKLYQDELEFVDGIVRYREGTPQLGEDIQEVGKVRDRQVAR